MPTATLPREIVPVRDDDPTTIQQFNQLLLFEAGPRARGTPAPARPKLVGRDGEMPLPESIYQLLCDIAPRLMRGETVFLIPEHAALTTQQAADILGMSRPYLKRLLDKEEIPYFRVGTHRRLRFADVMAYMERRTEERQRQMDELLAISDEMGAYDDK
jgi:excisionase family DNA binding protein